MSSNSQSTDYTLGLLLCAPVFQIPSADAYSPFLNLEGDAAEISSYGYSYSRGRTNIGGRGAWLSAVNDDAAAVAPVVDGAAAAPAIDSNSDAVTKIGSPAGKAAVRAAIQTWTGNYTGYTWSVRFQELDQHQFEEPVHLLVYLKTPGSAVQAIPARVDELNELRNKPNYCGSIAGFNEVVHVHSEQGDKSISRAVDLTHCLKEANLNPNVPAANPEDLSRGPAKVPVRLSDLRIVAVTADGKDVTDTYNAGKTVISWSVPVTRTAAAVRAAAAADPIEAEALAHPLAFPADQEVLSMAVGDVGSY